MRETIHPSNHLGLDAFVDSPINPLLCVRLADRHRNQSVTAMCFEGVTHTVCAQVTCQEYDRVLGQWDVTESWVCLLKHGVQHVLHWVSTLGELVEHDDQRLALVDAEPCVGVVACRLCVVVDHRHGNVAQVHVRYVYVRILKPERVGNVFQQ